MSGDKRYGDDATEAFAAFLDAVRGNDARGIEDAWETLSYWLLIMRAAPPDFADPRVRESVGAPRWARHGPGEPPEPGLYLRHSRSDPRGDFASGYLGALWRCAGDCPPDAREGWGVAVRADPPAARLARRARRGEVRAVTRYDCPGCGRAGAVWWDARARHFLCCAIPCCGFSAPPPPGQCACGRDRDHVAELLSAGHAEATKLWVASQAGDPARAQ